MSQPVILAGTFSAVGAGASVALVGDFNFSVYGTFVGTVQLQRSFDGTNWIPVSTDGSGTPANYSTPSTVTGTEIENGMSYRAACTSYTSGTIEYRLSQYKGAFP